MDRRKEEEKVTEEPSPLCLQTGNTVWDKKRKEINDAYNHSVAGLNELIKSRWIGGNQKWNINMFRIMLEETRDSSVYMLNMAEMLENMQKISDLQGKVIDLIVISSKGNSKEITDLKTKIKALLDTPAIEVLSKLLEKNEQAIEQIDKRREKLIRDSIV